MNINYIRLIQLQRKNKVFEESVLITDRCAKLAGAMYVCFTQLKDFQEEYEAVFCSNVPQLNDLKRKSKALEKAFDEYLSYVDKVWKVKSLIDQEFCVQAAEKLNPLIRDVTRTKGWGTQGEETNYGVNQEHLIGLINEINANYKKELDILNTK